MILIMKISNDGKKIINLSKFLTFMLTLGLVGFAFVAYKLQQDIVCAY